MVEVKTYDVDKTQVSNTPTKVIVHPLVLLSAVDHYTRVVKDTPNQRVVGILLGEVDRYGNVDCLNSFAVPFEEDPRNPDVWYLDHNFLDNMFAMFRKVSAREKIVGWYSTGPKIKKSDIDIHQLFADKYLKYPVYVIIDVKMSGGGIPTDAYYGVMEREDELTQPKMTFKHLESEIGALEAEEIGVEHLLRDVKDATVSSLSSSVENRMGGLKALKSHLQEIDKYLDKVTKGNMPVNQTILYQLQNVFNLLPKLDDDKQKSFVTKTNDAMMAMYLSSMLRSVVSLHDLIENKINLREEELKLTKKTTPDNNNNNNNQQKKDDKSATTTPAANK